MNPYSEHRLARYRKEDVLNGRKPIDSARDAQAAADLRDQEYRQALQENQNAIQYIDNGDGTQTATGGVIERNAADVRKQTLGISDQTQQTPLSVTNPNTGNVYTGATAQRLQGRLDSQAGSVTNPNTGNVYTGATAQRLQERLKLLQNGGGGQLPYGVSDPVQQANLDAAKAAEAASIQQQLDAISSAERTRSADQSASEAAASQNNKGMQSTTTNGVDITKQSETSTNTTQSGTSGNNTQNIDLPNPMQSIADSIRSLGPDYAILADSLLQQGVAINAQRGASAVNYADEVLAADTAQTAYNKVIDRMYFDAQNTYDEAKDFTDTMQTLRDKQLATEKENANNKLIFAENEAIRKQKRANDKDHNKRMIAQALGGGFGSPNWINDIAQAELEGETAISNLTKEFGFKRADVDVAYTNAVNDVYEFYGQKKLDALEKYRTDLREANQYRFSAAQTTEERKVAAKKSLNDSLASIATDQAAAIKEAAGVVTTQIINERIKKTDDAKSERESAMAFFQWTFANTNSTALRQNAIDRLSKVGFDTGGLTTDAIIFSSIEAINKQAEAKALANAEELARKLAGKFVSNDVDLVNVLYNAVRGSKGVTESTIDDEVNRNLKLLQEGKIQQFRDNIVSLAFNKFGTKEAQSIRIKHNSLAPIAAVQEELEKLGKDYGGRLKSQIEAGKSLFEILDKDQQYVELKAKLGRAQTIIRSDLFGAALTDTEKALADEFLAAWDQDEGATVLTKLKVLTESLTDELRFNFDSVLGTGSYDQIVAPTNPLVNASSSSIPMTTQDVWSVMNGGSPIQIINDVPPPKIDDVSENDVISQNIGGKDIKGQPYFLTALALADRDMYEATGKRLQINEHFRSTQRQEQLYNELSKKGARVAPPGESWHEKGLAVDISNHIDAAPYLAKYGIVNGLKGDMGHFSIGELNPDILASFSTRI